MPTKNERISLVVDKEEVTAVKAPPPGLIRESRAPELTEPFPIGDPGGDPANRGRITAQPQPPIVKLAVPLTAPPRPAAAAAPIGPFLSSKPVPSTMPRPLATAIPLRLRTTPVTPLAGGADASLQPPAARPPVAGAAPAVAAAPTSVPSTYEPAPAAPLRPAARPVVDLVPLSHSSGPFLAPKGSAWAPRTPSRVGLYSGLVALLLLAGGLFVGWQRWWSVRPGRIEISTAPPDALITVGSEGTAQHSPVTLDKPPGSYAISVVREGYARSDRTIDLRAGQEVVLSIDLAPLGDQNDGKHAPIIEPTAGRSGGNPAARRAATGGVSVAARLGGTGRPGVRFDPGRGAGAGAALIASLAHADEPDEPALTPRAAAAGDLREPVAPVTPNSAPPVAPRAELPAPAVSAAPAPAPTREPIATTTSSPSSSPLPSPSSARTIAGRVAKAQLAIDTNADEYRVKLPPSLARAEMKLSAVVKLCVSAEGAVSDIKLLKSADPAIDAQIPVVLGKWRYRPLMASGQPVPFCYILQYEIAAP